MPSKNGREKRLEQKTRRNLIIAFEGMSTEPHYFDVVKNARLFPKSIVSIVPLYRNYTEIGNSHPVKVLKFLQDQQKWIESKENLCPVDLFFSKYIKKVTSVSPVLKAAFYPEQQNNTIHFDYKFPQYDEMKSAFIEEIKRLTLDHEDSVLIDEAITVADKVMQKEYPEHEKCGIIAGNIWKPSNFGNNTYIMVVDRDQQSFSCGDVQQVSDACEKNGYKLIITNPNFEFWLALHCEEFEKEKMMCCIQEMAQLKYDEKKTRKQLGDVPLGPIKYLKQLRPEYKKNENFKWIDKERIEDAIRRSDSFCHTLHGVKKEISSEDLSAVGTNMADLFELMKEKECEIE